MCSCQHKGSPRTSAAGLEVASCIQRWFFLVLQKLLAKSKVTSFLADLPKSSDSTWLPWLGLFGVHAVWNTSKNRPLAAGNPCLVLVSSQTCSLQVLHVQPQTIFNPSFRHILIQPFSLSEAPRAHPQQPGLCRSFRPMAALWARAPAQFRPRLKCFKHKRHMTGTGGATALQTRHALHDLPPSDSSDSITAKGNQVPPASVCYTVQGLN